MATFALALLASPHVAWACTVCGAAEDKRSERHARWISVWPRRLAPSIVDSRAAHRSWSGPSQASIGATDVACR